MEGQFGVMYDRYFDDVYRYIYVKTGDKWDTEDLVSETFRKAYEKARFSYEESLSKAWLMTIAHNTVIDHYRKKKGLLIGGSLEFYLTPAPFDDPLVQRDEMECLQRSLQQLPKEELEIVNLRYFADMKFKDIAAILHKPDNSIRVKSGRITKKIALLMKKCLEGAG